MAVVDAHTAVAYAAVEAKSVNSANAYAAVCAAVVGVIEAVTPV